MTKPLSPAALAVRDAAFCAYDDENLYVATGERHAGMVAAAALRAAADQVVPEYETTPGGSKIWPSEPVLSIRADLLAIAAELEAQ